MWFLAVTLACGLLQALAPVAHAAGSQNLNPNAAPGFRANTEWRTSNYGAGAVDRRTLIRAFAKANEFILMGSTGVGVGSSDIELWTPDQVTGQPGKETLGSTAFTCNAQRTATGNAAMGEITSRTMELTGPDSIPGSVSGAYTPCWFQAPADGVYALAMIGPDGAASNNDATVSGDVGLTNPNDFNASQKSSVAAWDVTVRTSLTDAATTKTGRVFTYALAAFTGGNGRPVDFSTFVVTTDGFRYRTDDRAIDPNGWVQYANQTGFLDPNGTSPLYHDAVANNSGSPGQLTSIQAGVVFTQPQYPVFFETPDNAAVSALGIPLTATAPAVIATSFTGTNSGSTSFHKTGGTFSYTSNVSGVYEIVISRDGVNFDPTASGNRVLRGVGGAGTVTVPWDGKDNTATFFPPNVVGQNYPFKVRVHAGEYHFPFIDVENSTVGGPTVTMLNAPGGVCPPLTGGCTGAFYDDRGYTVSTGSTVGTPGAVLCGLNPPATPNSDTINGFDTSGNQRAFGANPGTNTNAPCTGSFGDAKGLDLWTYYPSPQVSDTLNIVQSADVAVSVSSSSTTPNYGSNVTLTVTATNNGPDDSTGITLHDALPAGLTFVSAVSAQGSYNAGTGDWTVSGLTNGTSTTLQITATVATPSAVTDTATKTLEDQADPVSANNQDSVTLNPVSADIGVAISASTTTPNVGSDMVLTTTATNNGPNNATGVQLTVPLPGGLTFVSAVPSQGTYNAGTGLWNIGNVANGAAPTLQITATDTATATQTVTATRTASAPPDPDAANDVASTALNGQQADLGLTKTVSSSTVNVGTRVTFTITLTNNGPTAAQNVTITDALPAGLTFVSAVPSTGSYNSGTAAWTLGSVANGAAPTLIITATVNTAGAHTNTASITADTTPDPVGGNNTASATVAAVTVTPVPTPTVGMATDVGTLFGVLPRTPLGMLLLLAGVLVLRVGLRRRDRQQ